MDEIKKLLDESGLLPLKDSGLTIISLYGVSEEKRALNSPNTAVTLANRIVGSKVFTPRNESLSQNTIELVEGLQLYVDHGMLTVYIFMDSKIDLASLKGEKAINSSCAHLVPFYQYDEASIFLYARSLIYADHFTSRYCNVLEDTNEPSIAYLTLKQPILPPSILPSDFISTLVSLNQIKANMYSHLAQYQSTCWKHWNITVPNALFEKKELERMNPSLLGWWGPAKGVPMLVFVAANIYFPTIIPTAIKKMQDTLQVKTKNIFRALHLIPVKPDGNTPNLPVEVKWLFLLPSSSQPIIHIVPAPPKDVIEEKTKSPFSFASPTSISSYLNSLTVAEPPSTSLYTEYSDKLLRNFVNIWTKAALTRHPLHSNSFNRKGNDPPKPAPLPTGIQFVSAMAPLLFFIFNRPITEDGVDFKKVITQAHPSTRGMIQQIEVILRKKIKDNVEIEKVFSKSHSMNLMEKCKEAYLQDSPPFYTEQYHTWKRNNVIRMYRSLARGPCMEEYAVRLERECDSVWKQGRQSCEHVSLTGKACRLKIKHEKESSQQKSSLRDDRSIMVDNTKHNSGFSFFHACDCGRTQKIRDDPFDIEEANIKFYNKFSCCLGTDRAALDIQKSTFGEFQSLVLKYDEIPPDDSALIYLGPSSIYKNNVGLDKVEGFMNNTNFLVPWSITTVNELKLRQHEAITNTTSNENGATLNSKTSNEGIIKKTFLNSSSVSRVNDDTSEWPVLGKTITTTKQNSNTTPVVVASLEAFPALGSTPQPSVVAAPSAKISTTNALSPTNNNSSSRQLFDTRRRRNHRVRDRIPGLIRGYVGAEYECPHGHRFLSCGEGRVCKLGHAGHPKEHGNYFVHQDLPVYVICPCTYANNTSSTNNIEVTAQLQRLYVVTPEEALTISIEPKIKIHVSGSEDPLVLNLGIIDSLSFGPSGVYVLRLPFIYRDHQGLPIPVESDIQKRLKSTILLKDCIKFHYQESKSWELSI